MKVSPYQVGDALVAGRHRRSCLVEVVNGELLTVEAPSMLGGQREAAIGGFGRKLKVAFGAGSLKTIGRAPSGAATSSPSC